MGCANSKSANEPSQLVALCRDRRELIRAAADHRFALAAAHEAYFRALGRVGDALQRFVQEELDPTPLSPVLTLPPYEGKGKGKATAELSLRDEAAGGSHGAGVGSGKVGAASAHFTTISHSHSSSDDSHLHLQSDSDTTEEIKQERGAFVGGAGPGWMGGANGGAAPIWMARGSSGAGPSSMGGGSSRGAPNWVDDGRSGDTPYWVDDGRSGSAPNWANGGGSEGPYWIGGGRSEGASNWIGGGRSEDASNWIGGGRSEGASNWIGGGRSEGASNWIGGGRSEGASNWIGGGRSEGASNWIGGGRSEGASNWIGGGSGGGAAPTWLGGVSGEAAPSWMNPFPYPSFYEAAPNPNYHYMKKSSTVPKTVYQTPYPQWPNSGYTTVTYGEGYPMYGAPSESKQSPPGQDDSFYRGGETGVKNAPDPPLPPAPEGSDWDFFDPFNSYEQYIPGYLQEEFRVSSATSSPNSSEVREKEGIPDLEEETEQDSVKETVKERIVDVDLGKRDSGAKAPSLEMAEEEKSEAEPMSIEMEEMGSTSEVRNVERGNDERFLRRKKVSFDESSLVKEENKGSSMTTLSAHGTRDVMEVVNEIKELFSSAASCGEEVSRILEVGKLRYKPGSKFVKVIMARIMDVVLPEVSPPSPTLHHLSATSPEVKRSVHAVTEVYLDHGKLSATLEKLYVWEKKLYKEVKEEENLRVIYDEQWKHLKDLDESGAESSEIDSTRASIRKLLTRLNMIIKSIDLISSRIHKLRDEELQPQLIELIQGLVRMWNSVLACHQKQFQAISESKGNNFFAKTGGSFAKVTIEFEKELLNWSSCFSNWVHMQKAYVQYLNGWLSKWLIVEREETPDGVVPFSPGRIGAPAAFVVSNDWHHSIDRISDVEVIESVQSFASNVHRLWETQDEEQRQKLKAEYLSKDLAKRLKSLEKTDELHVHHDNLNKNPESASVSNEHLHDHHKMALDTIRKRLDEERAKHIEIIKQVQHSTATNLRTGFIPIFQSLESFSLETLKAYEAVRVPDGGTRS